MTTAQQHPGTGSGATVRRNVAAAVLIVLSLAAFYFVGVSWLTDVDGQFGDLAVAATAIIGGLIALVTLLATLVVVRLRWLGPWWLAAPGVLLVLAVVRLLVVRFTDPGAPGT